MSGTKSSANRMAPNGQQMMQIVEQMEQLMGHSDRLTRQSVQLERSNAHLKRQMICIVDLDKQLRQQSDQLEQQKKHLDEQADQLAEQAQWIKQYNAKEIHANQLTTQITEQDKTIDNLSTQLVGIQPDLIQLSDMYHEQASKAIELDAAVQLKDNQLADQEETIKQLLTALEASQSKPSLASAISSYFK
jgi:chromosome segregation ATPase